MVSRCILVPVHSSDDRSARTRRSPCLSRPLQRWLRRVDWEETYRWFSNDNGFLSSGRISVPYLHSPPRRIQIPLSLVPLLVKRCDSPSKLRVFLPVLDFLAVPAGGTIPCVPSLLLQRAVIVLENWSVLILSDIIDTFDDTYFYFQYRLFSVKYFRSEYFEVSLPLLF